MVQPPNSDPLRRCWVRIPGSGRCASARTLQLNLARTLTNTNGPLRHLVHLATRREPFPTVALHGVSSETLETGPLQVTGESSKRPRAGAFHGGKRSREEESFQKRLCRCRTDVEAAQENSVARVFGNSASVDASTRTLPSCGDNDNSGNSARAGCPRRFLKPHSNISGLAEMIKEVQRRRDREREHSRVGGYLRRTDLNASQENLAVQVSSNSASVGASARALPSRGDNDSSSNSAQASA